MIRTLVFAAILVASPTLVSAGGCSGEHATQQAMSCAEGTIWDEQTRSCLKVTG